MHQQPHPDIVHVSILVCASPHTFHSAFLEVELSSLESFPVRCEGSTKACARILLKQNQYIFRYILWLDVQGRRYHLADICIDAASGIAGCHAISIHTCFNVEGQE